ncbi:MAG: benzoate-CoA ligase family protein [Vulcanimicrobiaceae bacterium]
MQARPNDDFRAAAVLPSQFNAAEWFVRRHVVEGRGARVAIVTDEAATSYAELDAAVRGFGAALQARGVRRGERIAIILPDGLAFAVAFFGALAIGAVAVPINPLLTAGDHRNILEDCDACGLVCEPATAAAVDGAAVLFAMSATDVLEAARQTSPIAAYVSTHRDAFAFMLYSSGTTGEPKGVVHLHHDMWVCARTYAAEILRVEPNDRAFSVAKLFFAYGLGNALYFPLDVGGAAILYGGRPTTESIFAQVAQYRPTLFFGVPTAYAQMLAAIDAGAAYDFSSVRVCVSAGEALPPTIFTRWLERTGVEILDGIGSTEILHIFLSNRAGECVAGSSGKAVPGYALRIVDERGGDVPAGEIGDLLVRGDSTAVLYWNKHERSKATIAGDWIRTGDKYRCDENGVYWHAGRSDDMLKVGGIWVSPVEVEAALAAHDAVLECAVVGSEDGDGLIKPHAFVVLREPHSSARGPNLEAELQAFVKSRIAPYKYPRWVTIVDALPKTATGKIQRFILRNSPVAATSAKYA